ncbi:hypothetical protein ACJJTC_006124 [Scirpophaga incertulas]
MESNNQGDMCVCGSKVVKEFEGLVKIVFLDTPKNLYHKKICLAGLMQVASMLLGATVVTILYFTLSMRLKLMESLHVILCILGGRFGSFRSTLVQCKSWLLLLTHANPVRCGLEFLVPNSLQQFIQYMFVEKLCNSPKPKQLAGRYCICLTSNMKSFYLLSVSTLLSISHNDAESQEWCSALMNEVDRQKQHLMLLVIGLLCGFVGGVLSLIHDGNFKLSLSPHSLTGFGLLVLTGMCLLSGLLLSSVKSNTMTGKFVGGTYKLVSVSTFVTSSVCFILGIYHSKNFIAWMPMVDLTYILMFFCFIYTVIICYDMLN